MTKAELLKWNTAIVVFEAGFIGFGVRQNSEHHLSLFHPTKGRLDYWPSTGKAMWMSDRFRHNSTFHIPDIEKYLQDHFA
jgi:hypothetical protein